MAFSGGHLEKEVKELTFSAMIVMIATDADSYTTGRVPLGR
jgi:hypothetical protein